MFTKAAWFSVVALYVLIAASFTLPHKAIPATQPDRPLAVNMDRMYPSVDTAPNPCYSFEGQPDDEAELKNTQVPIPMKDRVYNRTGIQCVWCSLECLGRWAEEQKLFNLTDLPDCKSYSSPNSAARKLNQIKVRFVQTTDKAKGREMIRKAVVEERRGVLFSIPGHAMNLVHYDEKNKIVKYINNSDKTLKIRTWTMEEFERRWEGWVCVIYADQDIIQYKFTPPAHLLPVIDRTTNEKLDPKKIILLPGK